MIALAHLLTHVRERNPCFHSSSSLSFLSTAPDCVHCCSSNSSKHLLSSPLDNTTSDRQAGVLLKVQINLASSLATLIDTPNDKRLSTTAITSREDTLHIGAVLPSRSLDVLASVLLDLVTQDTSLRSQETHGQEDEVGREELLRTLNLLHVPTTAGRLGPLNTDGVDALHLAAAVVDKLLRHDAELTGVLACVLSHLSVTVVDTVDAGPLGPRVVARTLRGRLRQQLKVDNRLGTVADRGTDAVVTGITTTNDNDVLVLGRDVRTVSQLGVKQRLGVLVKELHGEVDALEVAALDGKVTSDSGTGGDDDSIILSLEIHQLDIVADGNTGLEDDTLVGHELGASVDDALVKLHVGDTIHEQTTKTVSTLVDGDKMASLVQLIGGSKTSGTRTNDGNLLAGADLGRVGNHPALLETSVNDGALDGLDANGVFVDAENASTLAGSRANTTSELGEVVGHEETVEGVLPLVLENKLVPLGNDVGDGATSIRLAEGDTAVHAASGLILELVLVESLRKLGPVLDTRLGAAVLLRAALVLHEALGFVEHKSLLLVTGLVTEALFDISKLLGVLLLDLLLGLLLLLNARDDGKVVLSTLGLSSLSSLLGKDALVVNRQDLDEPGKGAVEVDQDAGRKLGASVVVVILDETAEVGNFLGVLNGASLHHFGVELGEEVLVDVKDVGDTTRHTGSEVAASAAKNDDAATSHVLATVVTNTLNDSGGTGVADGETLSSNTTEEGSTAGSTIQADVANENVLLSLEDGRARRVHDQATTRQALADIVVGITLELQGDTRSEESTEGLTG